MHKSIYRRREKNVNEMNEKCEEKEKLERKAKKTHTQKKLQLRFIHEAPLNFIYRQKREVHRE